MLGNIHDLAEMLKSVCPEVARPSRQLESICKHDCEIEQIKVDYARLFVGPYTLLAPPYGSVYLEGQHRVMGNSTLDVMKGYMEVGLSISEDFRDAPDHISAELEFMYYLVLKEIEAIAGGDYTIASDYLEKQKCFLENHLGVWISKFSTRVMENAHTEFYRALGTVTAQFVRANQEEMLRISLRRIDELIS
jgi:DMSO reductase family type II enzyme chaperone